MESLSEWLVMGAVGEDVLMLSTVFVLSDELHVLVGEDVLFGGTVHFISDWSLVGEDDLPLMSGVVEDGGCCEEPDSVNGSISLPVRAGSASLDSDLCKPVGVLDLVEGWVLGERDVIVSMGTKRGGVGSGDILSTNIHSLCSVFKFN